MNNWIEWKGGACPVDPDFTVEVKARNGEIISGIEAGRLDWERGLYALKHLDIIAYRVQHDSVMTAEEQDLPAPEHPYSPYFKDVRHIDTLDVYRVLDLFEVEKHGHPISHAVKKLLLSGVRTGGKDVEKDVSEAIDSLQRWMEMREEDARADS